MRERKNYILQERIDFAPVIDTPRTAQAEIRIMYVRAPSTSLRAGGSRFRPVLPLLRMGRGKMMGVDHNKGRSTWVGASAGLIGVTKIRTALWRGLGNRCPHCGKGRLFSGWSELQRCSICGLVFARNPGDTWAFTILWGSPANCRDHRLDLLQSGAFVSRAGRDARSGGGGPADLDGSPPLGRGYRAALFARRCLARSRGSYPAAAVKAPRPRRKTRSAIAFSPASSCVT